MTTTIQVQQASVGTERVAARSLTDELASLLPPERRPGGR
jgi:hypothetical protein